MLFESIIIFLVSMCAVVESMTGSGSGTPCADMALNCVENVALCTNPIYQGLMEQQCMMTCGKCSNGTCKDTNANCAAWKRNGFCESPFYDITIKQQKCALTCDPNGTCGTTG